MAPPTARTLTLFDFNDKVFLTSNLYSNYLQEQGSPCKCFTDCDAVEMRLTTGLVQQSIIGRSPYLVPRLLLEYVDGHVSSLPICVGYYVHTLS